ncbi:MAG: hypothetical protein ABW082_14980 [Sedimenticola sp.]
MVKLTKAVSAWQTPEFREILKDEIEALDGQKLPLQQGLTHASYAKPEGFTVMIISVSDDSDSIHVKAGIHYKGIIAGCNCSDDPTPPDETIEYCDVQLSIDKESAEATVRLVD